MEWFAGRLGREENEQKEIVVVTTGLFIKYFQLSFPVQMDNYTLPLQTLVMAVWLFWLIQHEWT